MGPIPGSDSEAILGQEEKVPVWPLPADTSNTLYYKSTSQRQVFRLTSYRSIIMRSEAAAAASRRRTARAAAAIMHALDPTKERHDRCLHAKMSKAE